MKLILYNLGLKAGDLVKSYILYNYHYKRMEPILRGLVI